MRYIAEYKLKDNTKAYYVVEASNKELATKFITRISSNVLNSYLDGKFVVQASMMISMEKWSENTRIVTSAAIRNYWIFGTICGSPFSAETGAAGAKTALNSLFVSSQMKMNTGDLIVIYDTNQYGMKKSAMLEAEKAIRNSQRLDKILTQGREAARNTPGIGIVAEDLFLGIEMIRDWKRKIYKDVPMRTVIALIATIIYLVSPVDIIPDVVPGLGVVDDAAVVGLCIKAVHDDIRKYEHWKSEQSSVRIDMG